MSNYVQTTFFTPKDSLPPSNPAKTIFGAAYDVELGNISTAIASKFDAASLLVGPVSFALGSASLPSITFTGETGTGLSSNGTGDLVLSATSSARLSISGTTGAVTIASASSGTTLTLTGPGSAFTQVINEAATTSFGGFRIFNPAAARVLEIFHLGSTNSTTYGAAANSSIINSSPTAAGLVISTADAARLTFSNTGNLVIAAPSAGSALTIAGLANSYTQIITAAATSGQSLGLLVRGGTTNADASFAVQNQGGTSTWLEIFGDGGVVIGNGTTGGDQGASTLNVSALYVQGAPVYSGIPQKTPNTAYVTILSDANTNLNHTSGAGSTYTIAANSSVAYPVGTAITFTNPTGAAALTIAINTDTLEFSPNGATGSRTLAASGIATAIKVAGTTWMISGTGLS